MPRYVILAHGAFDYIYSKTGNMLIRYQPKDVVAVIDSSQVGKTADDVILELKNFKSSVPSSDGIIMTGGKDHLADLYDALQPRTAADDIADMFSDYGSAAGSSETFSPQMVENAYTTLFKQKPSLMNQAQLNRAESLGFGKEFKLAMDKSSGTFDAGSLGTFGEKDDFLELLTHGYDDALAKTEGFLPLTPNRKPEEVRQLVNLMQHDQKLSVPQQFRAAMKYWDESVPAGTPGAGALDLSYDSFPQVTKAAEMMLRQGKFSKAASGAPQLEFYGFKPTNTLGFTGTDIVNPQLLQREMNSAIDRLNKTIVKNTPEGVVPQKIPYTLRGDEATKRMSEQFGEGVGSMYEAGDILYPLYSIIRQSGGSTPKAQMGGGFNTWYDAFNGQGPSLADPYNFFDMSTWGTGNLMDFGNVPGMGMGTGPQGGGNNYVPTIPAVTGPSLLQSQTQPTQPQNPYEAGVTVESGYGDGFFEPMRDRSKIRSAYKDANMRDDMTGKERRQVRRDARELAKEVRPEAVGSAPFNKANAFMDSKGMQIFRDITSAGVNIAEPWAAINRNEENRYRNIQQGMRDMDTEDLFDTAYTKNYGFDKNMGYMGLDNKVYGFTAQAGGEIYDVDEETLKQLIAAGAGIEIL